MKKKRRRHLSSGRGRVLERVDPLDTVAQQQDQRTQQQLRDQQEEKQLHLSSSGRGRVLEDVDGAQLLLDLVCCGVGLSYQ